MRTKRDPFCATEEASELWKQGANTKRPYVDTTARRPKPAPLRRVHMMDAVFSKN